MPSMITSTKNHTHPQKNKRTDVTLRQMVTAKLYRQNHKEAYIHIHTHKEIKMNKIKSKLLEKINKTDKTLPRLIKKRLKAKHQPGLQISLKV